jgi:predicted CXXCH cytochrome family protein
MKCSYLLIVSVLFLAWCPPGLYAAEQNRGPEFINLKMGNMDLQFRHWQHQTSAQNDCFNCHKTKIGQIDDWGEASAHKICIPCHDLENKGPVLCRECHNK